MSDWMEKVMAISTGAKSDYLSDEALVARAREAGYRRALEAAGYLPQSVDIMVERDRDWIGRGR